VVAGTATAYGTRWSGRLHWKHRIERLSENSSSHSILSLKGRHLHVLSEVACTVTDPVGQHYDFAWKPTYGHSPPLRKGDGPIAAYSEEFANAAWPTRGAYQVCWTAERPGKKALILYRCKWSV
jgi:hypothetical protein